MERLDKIVASQCGLTRSQAREKIWKGAVAVNGEKVTAIDRKIDPEKDAVTLFGEALTVREHLYVMMNKPAGYVSASRDREEKTVLELLPEELRRKDMAPAGRLDKDTEGLLILTDDGAFAHRLISPKKGVYKTYIAALAGPLGKEAVRAFEQGIELADGEKCLPAQLGLSADGMTATVRICEGKYHQVKRMIAAVGSRVVSLRRVKIGGVALDESLAPGECRQLIDAELDNLLKN